MALLDLALKSKVEILITPALILEYEAVLMRDEHLRVAELTPKEVDAMLNAVCRAAIEVRIQWNWRPQLHDPNDEMVLEAAINGHADGIVTFNRAHFALAVRRFGLLLLSPAEALERITIR